MIRKLELCSLDHQQQQACLSIKEKTTLGVMRNAAWLLLFLLGATILSISSANKHIIVVNICHPFFLLMEFWNYLHMCVIWLSCWLFINHFLPCMIMLLQIHFRCNSLVRMYYYLREYFENEFYYNLLCMNENIKFNG